MLRQSRRRRPRAKKPLKAPESKRLGRGQATARRPKNAISGYAPSISEVSGSKFKVAHTWAMAGQEDVELVRMRYETTSAFTATGGAASYLQIKGNSIYRPYPGNTDSPAGFARLFTQYERSMVLGSRVTVRLWSDTGAGVQQPFRIMVVPCSGSQYTIYSAFSNVAALRGVPHAKEALFSPGATMPVLTSTGTTAQILNGFKVETGREAEAGSIWHGTSTADPSILWYHLVGLQAMAGTTTLNAQIQVMIEFDVMFFRMIATAVQAVSVNKWGNEEAPETKSETKAAGVSIPENKNALSLENTDWDELLDEEKELSAALEQLRLKKLQRQAGAGVCTPPGAQVKEQGKTGQDESKWSFWPKKPP